MTPGYRLTTIAAFAVALGCLIVVHEYGHYLVARACGVKVLRFSVGFGKPLWMTRYGRDATEWVIAAFPLGGQEPGGRTGCVVTDPPGGIGPIGTRIAGITLVHPTTLTARTARPRGIRPPRRESPRA